jgi:thiamine biosynthesis lipoprotein
MLELFSLIDNLHKISGGLFDPTIQSLWKLYAENKGKPKSVAIEKILPRIGWKNVHYNSTQIQFNMAKMALTLNGIAQGLITDKITALLRSEGLENAVVNMGEIATLGLDKMGQPWQVGIAAMGDSKAEEYVALKNQAIATSYAMGTTFDGANGHIINPKSGATVSSNWARISVIHKSAAFADGLSTAALMMHKNQLQRILLNVKNTRIITRNNDIYLNE